MANLFNYNGLQLADQPNNAGGQALNDDFRTIADRFTTSGYLNGLRLAFVSVDAVSIGTGGALSADGSLDLTVTSPLVVDITTNGPNGLDVGTEAPSTWYAAHVIGDSFGENVPAGLLSLSATAPTLPEGYDAFRRVGWVRNDPSSNFLKFNQRWNGLTRRYWYDVEPAGFVVLVGGVATVFTPVSLTTVVPPTGENVVLGAAFAAFTPVDFWLVRRTGDTSSLVFLTQPGVATPGSFYVNQVELPCNASQSIEYRVSAATSPLTFGVQGYDDEL